MSSDPPFKDSNVRFTTEPLNHYSDQECGRYRPFPDSKSVTRLTVSSLFDYCYVIYIFQFNSVLLKNS